MHSLRKTLTQPAHPTLGGANDQILRLRPSAGFMRKNKEDAVIGSNVIPAHTELLFLPTIQHTDSEFFADPLEFRPERWLDGSTSSEAQTAAYFPFSSGTPDPTCALNLFVGFV